MLKPTKEELEKLELTLSKLEHTPYCPGAENPSAVIIWGEKRRLLCECGLSEGRRRLYNYIQSMRVEITHLAKSN